MDTRQNLAWLLVRVVFGASLAYGHGLPKIAGGNMDAFADAVAQIGFPYPLVFAWAAALSEFAGGILVALGFLARPAAAVVSFTMIVAMYSHRADAFGKVEMSILYLAVMLGVLIAGPGAFSVDGRMKVKAKPFRI